MLRKRREYKRNEKLTRAQLEAMQLRKFRELVAYAEAHSPYYADLIRQRGIDPARCTPRDFPVMDKSQLMEHFDDIVTDQRLSKAKLHEFLERSEYPTERFLDEFFVVHTSGSSGEMGIFVFATADWARGVPVGSRLDSLPRLFQPKTRVAFYGATDGHYGGVTFLGTLKTGARKLHHDVMTLDVHSPLPETVARLNEFQPHSLRGYVTGLKMLAEQQQKGELDIQPRTMSVGAEVLTEADRMYLQGVFACPVKNVYGASEHISMGSSLPGRSRIHLWEDDLIFELYEDHLVVTNLFNYTMPLIRYRMSDVLVPAESKESSMPYREVEAILGRAENIVKLQNRDGDEDYINPYSIIVRGIQRFQMQLLRDDHIRFLACVDPAFDPAEAVAALRRRLDEIAREKRLEHIEFEVEHTEDLPVDRQTGKHQIVADWRDESEGLVAVQSGAR